MEHVMLVTWRPWIMRLRSSRVDWIRVFGLILNRMTKRVVTPDQPKMKMIFEYQDRVFCNRVSLVDCERRCKPLYVFNTTGLPKTNEGICQYLSLSSVCGLTHFASYTPFKENASWFQDWPAQSVILCHWAGFIVYAGSLSVSQKVVRSPVLNLLDFLELIGILLKSVAELCFL